MGPVLLALLLAASPKVDPNLLRAFEIGQPVPGAKTLRKSATLPVSITLSTEATPAILARLQQVGVGLSAPEGRILFHRRLVPARAGRAAVLALADLPEVERVQFLGLRGPMPLDHSAALIGLAGARGARPALDYLTGKGMLVADIDTNVDQFHPMLFHGDAGYYDWIDVNGDGKFTPGVDAIDLNRNGVADDGEIAHLLSAQTLYSFQTKKAPARSTGFDPSIDWIFLDTNGNGVRDFGAAAGFSDSDPAFGEPLFVPDDVNRNGVIDVGERFVRLGTSKIRKIYVEEVYLSPPVSQTFVRGVDLATHPVDYSHGTLYGYPDAAHGTGVLSILLGDLPLVGRRLVGMAPEAEVVVGWEDDFPIKTTTWAIQEKPDAMLYEMCPWTGYPMDGSDDLSLLVDDASTTDDITQTCPVGDQAGARKHAFVTVPASGGVDLPFSVPLGYQYQQIELTLNIRGPGAAGVTATLKEPSGASYPLALGPGTLSSGAYYYPTDTTSPRSTRVFDTFLYTDKPGTNDIPVGNWTISVTGGSDVSTIDAFVADDVSGFSELVAWSTTISNDLSTLGIPSTADHCIAVAAHTGHPYTKSQPWFDDFPPNGQGQVRDYSPWGPRIDGVQKPDIAAPDNPWVAAPYDKMWPGTTQIPYGAVWPFGGTSGASPHVTGLALLLAQAGIRADQARDVIRAGGFVDSDTGAVPNNRYGWGRLNAAAALGASATGTEPTVAVTANPAYPQTGASSTLQVTASDPDGSASDLQLKWDDDYDGTWDTAWAPVADRVVVNPAGAGPRLFKARVRDATGRVAEAVVRVVWSDLPPDAGTPDSGAFIPADASAKSDSGLVVSPDASVVAADASLTDASAIESDAAVPTSDAQALAVDSGPSSPGPDAAAAQGDAGRAFADAAEADIDAASKHRDAATADGGGTPPPATGCGCTSGSGPTSAAVAMVILAGWFRRRRAA